MIREITMEKSLEIQGKPKQFQKKDVHQLISCILSVELIIGPAADPVLQWCEGSVGYKIRNSVSISSIHNPTQAAQPLWNMKAKLYIMCTWKETAA